MSSVRRRRFLPDPELLGQLAFKTSSSKKRKLARPLTHGQDEPDSPSPDTALPSCEPEDDPALSFTSQVSSFTPDANRLDAPPYVRPDPTLPFVKSRPPRLQTQAAALVSADCASSAASPSPSASAYAGLSLESDRGADEAGIASSSARSQSPFRFPRRSIMNGEADLPHRSSSPLKRRASSMDPEMDGAKEDVSETPASASAGPVNGMSRHMSADAPDSMADSSVQRKPDYVLVACCRLAFPELTKHI